LLKCGEVYLPRFFCYNSGMFITLKITALLALLLPMFLLAQVQSLTPEQVIKLAIKNSTKIELSRINLALADSELPAAHYPFDWNLTLNLGKKSEHLPSSSIYEGGSYRQHTFGPSAGMTRLFTNGIELDMSLQFLEYQTTSATTLFSKRKQLGSSATINVPLIKGRGYRVNTIDLQLANLKQKKYQAKLADRILETVQKALEHLLTLYQLREDVTLKEQDLNYSKKILDFDRARFAVGKISRLDYLNSQALYQKKIGLLEAARLKAYNRDMLLQKEIFPPHITGTVTLHPKLQLKESYPSIPAIPRKLGILPSVLIEKVAYQEAQVDIFEAKNGLLPQVDLNIALSNSGLGAEASTAIDQVTQNKFFNWEIGLNLSWIFGNYQAKGTMLQKSEKLNRAVVNRRALFREKLQKWRTTKSEMVKLVEGVVQLKGQITAASSLLEYKLKQYKLQEISSLELAQAQQDMLQASQDYNAKMVKLAQTRYQLLALDNSLIPTTLSF
jgi:outer membrane protein TolC